MRRGRSRSVHMTRARVAHLLRVWAVPGGVTLLVAQGVLCVTRVLPVAYPANGWLAIIMGIGLLVTWWWERKPSPDVPDTIPDEWILQRCLADAVCRVTFAADLFLPAEHAAQFGHRWESGSGAQLGGRLYRCTGCGRRFFVSHVVRRRRW